AGPRERRADARARLLPARDQRDPGSAGRRPRPRGARAAHRPDRRARRGRVSDAGRGAEPEGPRWWPVAGERDLAPGEVTVVGADDRSFALGRTADGAWGAIDNVCTH